MESLFDASAQELSHHVKSAYYREPTWLRLRQAQVSFLVTAALGVRQTDPQDFARLLCFISPESRRGLGCQVPTSYGYGGPGLDSKLTLPDSKAQAASLCSTASDHLSP